MSDGRLAGVLFLAAFLARLVMFLGTPLFGTDGGQFLWMADRMGEARFHDALAVTYHPMYPFLIAAARTFLGSAERAGFWISMVLGAGAVVPLFSLARAVFGRPAAFIAALLYAFHPYTVELNADVMTEGTFAFFLFWAMWLGWRVLEDPSIDRAVLAALSAAAAYLTRAEGMLAMALVPAWQAVELLRRRDRWAERLGGIGLGLAAMALLVFPFLLWVRSVHPQKKWALSAKWSVTQAGEALKVSRDDAPVPSAGYTGGRYGKLGSSMVRMMYYVGIPFYLLGLLGLRGLEWRKAFFYFSFPLLHVAGLVWALQKVPYMSYRYVVPVMNILGVVMALGVIQSIRFLARRWPEPRWVLASQALVLVATALTGIRLFNAHRADENPAREAAAWIRAQGGTVRGICTTVDQVAYLSGARLMGFPPDWPRFSETLDRKPIDYFVYTDKDLARPEPPYVGRLREYGRLEPPAEIKGGRTIYIQRVKR